MAKAHTAVENLSIVSIDGSSDDYDDDDNYEEYCIPAMESTLKPKQSRLGIHLKYKTDSKSCIEGPRKMCPCKMKLQLQCVERNERNHLICRCKTKTNTKSSSIMVPKQMCICKKKVIKSNVNNERKRANVLLCGCRNKYPSPLPKFHQVHYQYCCNDASSPSKYLSTPKVNQASLINLNDKSHIYEENSKNESPNSEGELWQLVKSDGTEVAVGYLKKVKKTNESKLISEIREPLNVSTSKSHEEISNFKNTLGDEDKPVQEYNWSFYNDSCFILEPRSLEGSTVSNSKLPDEKISEEPDVETNPPNPSRLSRSGINYRPKDIDSFPSPSEASPFWNSFSNAKLKPPTNEASCDCNTNKDSARVRRRNKTKMNSVEFEPAKSSPTSTLTNDDPCVCNANQDSEIQMNTSLKTINVKDQVINLLLSPDPVKVGNILFMPIMKETSTQTLLNSNCDALSTISVATQTSRTLHSHENLSLNQTTTTRNDNTPLCYINYDNSDTSESQEIEQTSTQPMITQSDIHIFNVSFPNNYYEVKKIETSPTLLINTTKFKRNDVMRSISYSSAFNDDKTSTNELIESNEQIFSLCDSSVNSKEEESPKHNDVMFVAQISEGMIQFREDEIGCENLSVGMSTPDVNHIKNTLSAVIKSIDTEM